MPDDAERFRGVAEACKALGMSVGALKVGDIEVRFAQPWGTDAPQPSKRARARAEAESTMSDDDKALVQRSREQFGRVLPLEKLRAMRGALLGHA